VRLAALDYFARLGDPKTLPFLVDALEAESGRLKQEVVETLKSVTGKDYGRDAAKWRAYAGGGAAAADAAGAKPADPAAGGGRAVATGEAAVEPTYYGQKIWSDRVVFIIDLSLSMLEEMVIDRERLIRETGAVVSGGSNTGGEGAKPEKREDEVMPIEWWKIKTRMDFARSQLKFAISTLKRDQWFDVVWFSDSVKTWQGRMIPATAAAKVKAAEWLDELKCEGGTNTWGGLTKGLNLVGRGTDEENYGRGADTLYFLSDGAPSIGDVKDPDAIVAAMERIHKVRRVKINVVQIGTSPLPFMKRLASVTGGEYKFFNAKGPAK
jgi:Mg-chelatase subunit ChlD